MGSMEFIELKDIKNKMVYEISEYEEALKELDNLTYKVSVLEEILRILDVVDLSKNKDNSLTLSFLLQEVFSEEENIYDKVLTYIKANARKTNR